MPTTTWLNEVRARTTRSDREIYCFCSPTDEMIEQDRYPYAPGWVDLSLMSCVQARKAADYLGAPLVRGDYNDYVNEWDMSKGGAQITISNRLATKIDTIN